MIAPSASLSQAMLRLPPGIATPSPDDDTLHGGVPAAGAGPEIRLRHATPTARRAGRGGDGRTLAGGVGAAAEPRSGAASRPRRRPGERADARGNRARGDRLRARRDPFPGLAARL